MRPRKSRASAADRPPLTAAAARGLALAWLGQRELSRQQVRDRLVRRGLDGDAASALVDELTERGLLDDERVARAAARRETAIKGRGPARTRATLKALGLPAAVIDTAVDAALDDIDADTLLERALARRLRGQPAGRLDPAATRRIVAALVRQGFSPGAVFARLRRRGVDVDEPSE